VDAWSIALWVERVCVWFAARVEWVRDRWASCVERVERCWVRNWERVDSESEMRRREAVSFWILKWEVHWDINYGGRGLVVLGKGYGEVDVRRRGLRRGAFWRLEVGCW
jgi:hypothetical protein